MIKIILICANGMSTSMISKRMQKSAEEKNLEVQIQAMPDAELASNIGEAKIVLVAPQIQYMYKKIKAMADENGIVAELINPADYGMANGAKILDDALKLL